MGTTSLDSLICKWRKQFLQAGVERLSGKAELTEVDELSSRIAKLERALGRKTMERPPKGQRRAGRGRSQGP